MTVLIVLAALVVVAVAATIRSLVTDGYHRVPTCAEAVHCYR